METDLTSGTRPETVVFSEMVNQLFKDPVVNII
jgi:hypothetical protein